ncbi:hypothetical protein [Streptomyces shaanxiensis]
MADPKPTVAVLTAHPRWYAAVRKRLTDVRRREHPSGTRFDTGALPETPWEVAVADMGTGNDKAGEIVGQAAAWLRPQVLMFLGSAGAGRFYVQVGDVVLATKVYLYDPQASAAPRPYPASHRLEQAARMALREGSGWCETEAAVHFGPLVALPDDAVDEARRTDDRQAVEHGALRKCPDAVAVELRSMGIACDPRLTGSFGHQPEVLTVRGITFCALDRKSPDLIFEQVIETTVAAAVAVLAELVPWSAEAASAGSADAVPPVQYRDHIDYRYSTFEGSNVGKQVNGEDSRR